MNALLVLRIGAGWFLLSLLVGLILGPHIHCSTPTEEKESS